MRTLILAGMTAVAAFACTWDYPIWIPRSPSADPLYRFVKGGKAGYIDQRGKVVVPPVLEDLFGNYGAEFHDGLVGVSASDGKYADKTGKVVLNPGLFRGWDFSEGLAAAMKVDGGLWGYINPRGEWAIPPRFATSPNGYVYPFAGGAAKIDVKGLFGFIDRTGEFIIPARLLDASDFNEDRARVVMEGPCVYFPEGGCGFANPVYPGLPRHARPARGTKVPACKFTYIDKSGSLITEQRFDNARDFSEGLAPVQIGQLWGFVNRDGTLAISPRFEDAYPFHSGRARIRVGEKYGYVGKSGETVIPAQLELAEDFSDGLAVVGDGSGERYWYIDTYGVKKFGDFEVASPFFKGLAHVKLIKEDSDVYAYIYTKGRTLFQYEP